SSARRYLPHRRVSPPVGRPQREARPLVGEQPLGVGRRVPAGGVVTVAFPKPVRKPRKRSVASLKAHYSRVAAMPSCVSGKSPVVLHHVPVTSPKSRQSVRKRGSARA